VITLNRQSTFAPSFENGGTDTTPFEQNFENGQKLSTYPHQLYGIPAFGRLVLGFKGMPKPVLFQQPLWIVNKLVQCYKGTRSCGLHFYIFLLPSNAT
jgi:hypothetical protein